MSTPTKIRIRIGHARNGANGVYANATFAEAVAYLQGTHEDPEDGHGGYHSRQTVYVVAAYAEDHQEQHGPKRVIDRKMDEPVFGFEITIYGRDTGWGKIKDAEVSWGSLGSMSVDEAARFWELTQLAVQIAKAANAEPVCPACQAHIDARAALYGAGN